MISKELSQYFKYFIFFIIIALLIAPLWHELMHIIILTFYACSYGFSFAFDWIFGFSMMFAPLCELSTAQSIVALSISFFGDLIISFVLFLSSHITMVNGKIKLSNYLIYAAMGFLIGPMFTMLASRGNIIEILNLSGFSNLIWVLPVIGSALFALALLYFWSHIKHID